MKTRNRWWSRVLMVCLVFSLMGCSQAFTNHTIWIEVPLNGAVIKFGQSVQIEGHAADSTGVSEIQIWINGTLMQSLDASLSGERLYRFQLDWLPPEPGEYDIQALSINTENDKSVPAIVHIVVSEGNIADEVVTPSVTPTANETEITETPTLEPSPTPTPTLTITPVPTPIINFWAEPESITAGQCSKLNWHVENVQQVIFGGISQAFDGSFDACLCETTVYPLTVQLLDGSEERHTVQINVTGSCVTPTVPDTTPPPAPLLQKPANGVSLSCVASTTLMWSEVNDPSGISQYQIEAQRHSGDLNWQAVSGSPFGGVAATTTSLNVECGWTYRWRVRAVDGVGNQGNWSDWFLFTIPLG